MFIDFYFTESKTISYVPIVEPFHESLTVLDVFEDNLVVYKSSLNKPGQLFLGKVKIVNGFYDFNNISVNEISPLHELTNSTEFIVEHGITLHSKNLLNSLICVSIYF